MRNPTPITYRPWLVLFSLTAFTLSGCMFSPEKAPGLNPTATSPPASGPTTSSSFGTAPAPAANGATAAQQLTQAQVVQSQVQTITAPMNQTAQYALTSDDIALLQTNGLVAASDVATLTPLIQTSQ